MDLKYRISFVIYSLVQILLLLYILMWSLGMSVNAQLNFKHFLLITLISFNILLIGFMPTITSKLNQIKKISKFIGLLFLGFNLLVALKFLFDMLFHGADGGFFMILFLKLFVFSAIYLIVRIVKL
jgi:hypothetical protein